MTHVMLSSSLHSANNHKFAQKVAMLLDNQYCPQLNECVIYNDISDGVLWLNKTKVHYRFLASGPPSNKIPFVNYDIR